MTLTLTNAPDIVPRPNRLGYWGALSEAQARAIVDEVAARHNITSDDIFGRYGGRIHSHPRQEAMWAVRKALPRASLPLIARFFDRDHTTVLYGIRQHEKRMGEGG